MSDMPKVIVAYEYNNGKNWKAVLGREGEPPWAQSGIRFSPNVKRLGVYTLVESKGVDEI